MIFCFCMLGAVAIVGVIVAGCSFLLEEWPKNYWYNKETVKNSSPTITFDMFLSLYTIAPEKWHLYDDTIRYVDNTGYYEDRETVRFKTYKDLKRYTKWYKIKDTEETIKRKNNNQKKFLELWNQDIANYRKKNNQETLEAIERLYKDCQKMGTNQEILATIEQTMNFYKEMKKTDGSLIDR